MNSELRDHLESDTIPWVEQLDDETDGKGSWPAFRVVLPRGVADDVDAFAKEHGYAPENVVAFVLYSLGVFRDDLAAFHSELMQASRRSKGDDATAARPRDNQGLIIDFNELKRQLATRRGKRDA